MSKIHLLLFLCVSGSVSASDSNRVEFLAQFLRVLARSSCVFVDDSDNFGLLARNFLFSVYMPSHKHLTARLFKLVTLSKEKIVVLIEGHQIGLYEMLYHTAPTLMTRLTWIVFFNSTVDALEVIGQTPVPYDSEFYVVKSDRSNFYDVSEIFTMEYSRRVFSRNLGVWTEEMGLSMRSPYFFSRRKNLEGHKMKVLVKQLECETEMHCGVRKIWFMLAEYMNMTTDLWTFAQDFDNMRTGGPFQPWDANLEPVLFESNTVFAKTIAPVWKLLIYIHVKRGSYHEFSWRTYFSSFESDILTTFTAWVVIVSLSLTFLDYHHLKIERRRKHFQGSNGTFAVLFWICNQGGVKIDSHSSAMFLVFTVRVAVLVLQILGTSALVSLLTLRSPRYPFYDVHGFLMDDTYKLAAIKDGFPILHFEDSPIIEERLVAAKLLSTREMPETLRSGADMICADEKFALLAENNDLLLMEHKKCHILRIPSPVAEILCGIMLNHESPFEFVLNAAYIRLMEVGIARKIKSREYLRGPDDNDNSFNPITLDQLQSFFAVVHLELTISVGVCAAERLLRIVRKRYARRKRVKIDFFV